MCALFWLIGYIIQLPVCRWKYRCFYVFFFGMWQHFTDRMHQLVKCKYMHLLRWKRFLQHTSVIESLYVDFNKRLWFVVFLANLLKNKWEQSFDDETRQMFHWEKTSLKWTGYHTDYGLLSINLHYGFAGCTPGLELVVRFMVSFT